MCIIIVLVNKTFTDMPKPKCECRARMHETDIRDRAEYQCVVFLQKLYYCENYEYPHQTNVCQFPDCKHSSLYNRSFNDVKSTMFHIIKTHHDLGVVEGSSGNIYVNADFVLQGLGIWINMSNILHAIPHFLGLVCAESWCKIVCETCEYDDKSDSMCYDDIINVLYTLDYSCALCGEEY